MTNTNILGPLFQFFYANYILIDCIKLKARDMLIYRIDRDLNDPYGISNCPLIPKIDGVTYTYFLGYFT